MFPILNFNCDLFHKQDNFNLIYVKESDTPLCVNTGKCCKPDKYAISDKNIQV